MMHANAAPRPAPSAWLPCRQGVSFAGPRRRPGYLGRRLLPKADAKKDAYDINDWLRRVEEQAEKDEDMRALMEGARGDAAEIARRIKQALQANHAEMSTGGQSPSLDDIMQRRRAGETRPVRVRFRSVDPFDLWIWVELYSAPPPAALGMLREVVDAWYLMGRLGAYDAGAMTVWQASQYDVSNLEYDRERDDGPVAATPAAMHSMADLETQGPWVRFWVDLGSADELALDLLINALRGLSVDHLGIRSIVVGGVNDDWPVPEKAFPELTMSPMRTSMPEIDPASGFNPYDSDDLEESLRQGFWDKRDGDG